MNEESAISRGGQSPLFAAQHAARYERQALIQQYQDRYSCRLVVVNDAILPYSVTLFEELIYDNDPATDIHLMLSSPGGDGETAVRLARSAQARCRELTIIVPDQAKSAGTLLALGAHHITMGPTSDLGPVDPQLQLRQNYLVAAKDIIAAVEDATARVAASKESYPLFASMLSDINLIILQQAKAAMGRADNLLKEAISANPSRTRAEVDALSTAIKAALLDSPHVHAAGFGAHAAAAAGLPIIHAETQGHQWKLLWALYTRYFQLGQRVYEGLRASQTLAWQQPTPQT
jgi:hypothetical protein